MSAAQPEPQVGERTRPVFVPGLLFGLALLGSLLFSSSGLLAQRNAIAAAKVGQETQIQQSQKVRAALDALAASTLRLANSGDANAKLVVDELRKRGVTINPSGPPLSLPPQ